MGDPDNSAQAVRAALRGQIGELPPAPAAAVKLLRLTRDENTAVTVLARAIETEPALAAKILRIVNSAYYGFPQRIQSIRRAVTLLGFSTVRQAALHVLVYEGLVPRGRSRAFDRLFFWQHSLLVAILSRGMAERLGHPDPDALYAAGLLHDLGKSILETHGRVGYSDFLAATAHSGNPLVEDEQAFFGVTHDQVGAFICEAWELPEPICRVQSLHHHRIPREDMPTQQVQEVAIVALADFIAWTQGVGSVARQGASPLLQPEVTELIDPSALELSPLLERADAEIREIGAFYELNFPSSQQLRANLITTAIGLSGVGNPGQEREGARRSCFTAPHHSLDPDEFVPWTLEAVQRELGFTRLLLLQVESRRRSLVATHAWPADDTLPRRGGALELVIPSLSGDLVACLRERRPVLLQSSPGNRTLLNELRGDGAAAVPVLSNGRLQGLLCLCRDGAGGRVDAAGLMEVQQVAGELGIALARCRVFAMERARAEFDSLTRLHNRSAADSFLARAFREANDLGRRVAVGLVDIDHFKGFNDTFGHQAGDDVLRIVAGTLRGATRPGDFIGRYGGEEFLFVLMDADEQGASLYGERIRREIERRGRILTERFPGHALTVSVGLTLYRESHRSSAAVVADADRALYRAKGQGRNRVVADWSAGPQSAPQLRRTPS
jgi:two-component system cell cycle response regulator